MDSFEVLARLAEHGTPPDGNLALKISVGLEDTLQQFKKETLSFVASGGSEIRFVYGPYGRGKTHFLKSVQAVAKSEGFVTSYVDCKSQTTRAPFASLTETYRLLAENSVLPRKEGTGGIEEVIRGSVGRLGHTSSLIRNLRKADRLDLGFKNLVIALIQTLESPESPQRFELLRALGSLLASNGSYSLPMQQLYRMSSNLPKPLGKISSRNATLWIRSLAALPSSLKYPGFVILFDETEKSHNMTLASLREQQQYLVNIRNLVDHIATGTFSGCVFVFAVVEEFREQAETCLEALAQRIERIHFHKSNPRAVWTSLDELTSPSPNDASFFKNLGDRVIEIAIKAGMPATHSNRLREQLNPIAIQACQDISTGSVRQFVKLAAEKAAQLVNHKEVATYER